jgi:mannosidase alpha-like ER degradation enhancer 3
MPLSCKGRYRQTEAEHSRGDIDDALGNFTLTLVDSLDTLALLGKLTEFEQAVKNVLQTTHFNNDIIVSVFETNIRMIGGLIGGHISALYIREKYPKKYFTWYKSQLLEKAKELGYKLLPAFNTNSGLPVPRINLKHGITNILKNSEREKFTCTACAGTLLLEFATLSRLTGDPIFEQKARTALDYIWDKRNRASDLVGTILNIQNGDWINKDATIGAGIDSYYEYLLKGYVLLGDESLLHRFNRHYDSVMKFMSQQHGSIMQTVHMHMPYKQARNYMDALLAFWPGLQVLKGDLKEAIKMHELLYQIVKKHKFLPEAFLPDHSVHWSNHPLRPEFLESTYFLYRATKDPYYLEIGKQIIEHLELYSRVPCGYAAIADVKTARQDDRIDSFVYAETFKYLYLLFEEPDKLEIDVDEFIFTTEAHLIPLSLVNYKLDNQSSNLFARKHENIETNEQKSCESLKSLFHNDVDAVRRLRQSVTVNQQTTCGSTVVTDFSEDTKRLRAGEFIAGKQEHIELLKAMGIKIQIMNDGRLQLVHHTNDAYTTRDAHNGLLFMNEMVELSKQHNFYLKNDDYKPVSLIILKQKYFNDNLHYLTGPAQFGLDLRQNFGIFGMLEVSEPVEACTGTSSDAVQISASAGISNRDELRHKIVLTRRGGCMFIDKVRNLERVQAKTVIIYDSVENTSFINSPLFAMSGDGLSNVKISSVFLFSNEAKNLKYLLNMTKKRLIIYLGSNDTSMMEYSFYMQLEELRNYMKFDFRFKCKSASIDDFFNSKTVKICLKGDYGLLKSFFDFFNESREREVGLEVEVVKFDGAGVIMIVISNGRRHLKLDLADMIKGTGVDFGNSDEITRRVYDELRKKFELNTNILQLDDYNEYMNMLLNLVKIIVNSFTGKVEDLVMLEKNDQDLLNKLAGILQANQDIDD